VDFPNARLPTVLFFARAAFGGNGATAGEGKKGAPVAGRAFFQNGFAAPTS